MKQVIQSARSGELSLKDVPEPRASAGSLLVRTHASLISAGTEKLIIDFAKKNLASKAKARPDLVRKVVDKAKRDGIASTFKAVMARLDAPLPLGYSAAGSVVEVGQGLEGRFHVGQRIAIAGAGLANHAELNVVPENLVAPIPDDVPDAEACYGTLGAIALHGVRNLDVRLGECVAVVGTGLLGQIAVQLLSLSGIRVVALDYNPDRLNLARDLGAELALSLESDSLEASVRTMTRGMGCDAVLIAAATESSEPFATAAAVARDRARVVLLGMTGTEFPYREFMQKELNVTVSRSYGPGRYDEDYEGRGLKYPVGFVRWTETENLREVLRLMSPSAPRRLDVAALTTHEFPLETAENAYTMVTSGSQPHLGVILTYPEPTRAKPRPRFPEPKAEPKDHCVLGVLGAGNFARTVLLPELKGMGHVDLRTIVTTRGATAEHAQSTFGFDHAGTDADLVLNDPNINAVLVATRHGSHADYTARALAAGKSVLVEKPLALDRDQLTRVIEARSESKGFFQVGFNRRFSPLAVRMRKTLGATQGPKVLTIRINAGALPPESWINAKEEGGGRILGEVCHFIDLARFFVRSPIRTVQADAAQVTDGVCDDLAISLRFGDGSLANITYTAQGDTAFSKELYEGFAGGRVVVLDNFRKLTTVADGKATNQTCNQDKGFRQSMEAFVQAVAGGGGAPINEGELIDSSLATIAITESLRSGSRIEL
ncbi:bi-domain-containing oxidoreductase [Magnetospira sp. QH-2]|uniref:bi-domain-containing oxidoreductase n=1 Tax=Magnetospira sp. (strain QH-2) TaxID=1288970 RepID=UPI0003E8158F|nr:bi-domain-containing oxidoreductase [Magnetospira sp. QH-2]CCQ72028.1 putative L-threonine 3-dehydrogenase [Magnetospira sp. QH-2]